MTTKARVIVQQVTQADLLVDNVDKWEHIDNGIIVYVCFLQSAIAEDIGKIVKDILESNIVYNTVLQQISSPLVTGSDIMIIPQASMGGKIKNKNLQYHTLVEKVQGKILFDSFVDCVRERINENSSSSVKAMTSLANARLPVVVGGTYSNRQGLKLNSYGPSTNVLDY